MENQTVNVSDNVFESLILFLHEVGLSEYLSEETLHQFATSLEIVTLAPSEILFHEGDRDDALYLLWHGEVQLEKGPSLEKPLILGQVAPAEWVGELLQVLLGAKSTRTVRALEESDLLRFPKKLIQQTIEQVPSLGGYFVGITRQRLREKQVTRLLSTVFATLDDACLKDLKQQSQWLQLRRGECLCRQGDPADSLYLVVNGRFNAVLSDEEGSERLLGTIATGEIIGELSVLTQEPRSVSVYALRDSALICYSQSAFQGLMDRHPKLLLKITQQLIERFKQRESGVNNSQSKIKNIVLLAHDRDTPLREFSESLARSLSAQGNVLYLNRDRLTQLLESPGIADVAPELPQGLFLQLWLEEQEKQHPFILFEADSIDSPWTQRCIRQADRIVWVARSSENPSLTSLEKQVKDGQNSATALEEILVLLHPDNGQLPKQTYRWLQPRELSMHHNVRWLCQEDIDRVGRFLTDRAVGLALGGGGARGFAHIGVLQALSEASTPIDFIGGTSIGGLVGAQYAMGWDLPTMVSKNKEIATKNNPFVAYTIPIVSLMDTYKLDRMLQNLYGEVQIEDLWLNFFCVSTNISTGKKVVHRTGDLWKAIRATIAIPGFFVPFIDNGELLIDGGGFDNDPSLTMRELSPGPIVLSSITPSFVPKVNFTYEELPSPWKIFWSWVNPWVKPVEIPNLADLLAMSMSINNVSIFEKSFAIADLTLAPPLDNYALFKFTKIDEMISLAREYSLEKLKNWSPPATFDSIDE